jgi:hypothetical protein
MRMGGFWGIRRVVRFEGEVFFFFRWRFWSLGGKDAFFRRL